MVVVWVVWWRVGSDDRRLDGRRGRYRCRAVIGVSIEVCRINMLGLLNEGYLCCLRGWVMRLRPDVRGWEGTLACHFWKDRESIAHNVDVEIDNIKNMI